MAPLLAEWCFLFLKFTQLPKMLFVVTDKPKEQGELEVWSTSRELVTISPQLC